jgi:hypothetical protein
MSSTITPSEDFFFSVLDCVELEYEDYRPISSLNDEEQAELFEALSEEYCLYVPDEASDWTISQLAKWIRGQS